ncbi:hypothetical protein EB008_05015 [bacterium]|nr:hypothetical protein [bacterium]
MFTRSIQENSALKWVFHALFVAFFVLFIDQVHFFRTSRQIASSFIQATSGMVLFEVNNEDLKGFIESQGNSKLESFILKTHKEMGEPRLHVLTDATSSSFVKLEHAKKIQTSVLLGAIDPITYTTASKVYFATTAQKGVGLKKDNLKPLTKNEVFKSLGWALYQESPLMKKYGLQGGAFFACLFVLLNILFASVYRHSLTGILNLRFFGVPSSTIIPLMLGKNALLLLLSFCSVWLLFTFSGFHFPLITWFSSYFLTLLLSAFWSFFGTFKTKTSI